jgi:hypothetical protein
MTKSSPLFRRLAEHPEDFRKLQSANQLGALFAGQGRGRNGLSRQSLVSGS